jgi:hypothetical protein
LGPIRYQGLDHHVLVLNELLSNRPCLARTANLELSTGSSDPQTGTAGLVQKL